MLTLLFDAAVAVVIFVAGAGVGAANATTVKNSIATLQAAEAKAKATLDTITAHKAS